MEMIYEVTRGEKHEGCYTISLHKTKEGATAKMKSEVEKEWQTDGHMFDNRQLFDESIFYNVGPIELHE
jgi:hypothetical protein